MAIPELENQIARLRFISLSVFQRLHNTEFVHTMKMNLNLKVEFAFHGTNAANIDSIIAQGLLIPTKQGPISLITHLSAHLK